jgi:hypothetical protein
MEMFIALMFLGIISWIVVYNTEDRVKRCPYCYSNFKVPIELKDSKTIICPNCRKTMKLIW